ncbi:hypothetical protein [Vibrio breoganii]|uniref:hypothetical protein n=1 Tax=Vibrio breoganii TaxID=553239 RepID=UPI001055F4BC|nr:hypothetical protein [Vibrio breoganii]
MHLDTSFAQLIIFSASFVFATMASSTDIGVFNLSQQIVTSSLVIVSVFQVYVGRMINDAVTSEKIKSIIKISSAFSGGYIILMTFVSIFVAKYYMYVGNEFSSLYIYIFIMSFAGVFSIFNKSFIPILIKEKQTKYISLSTMFSGGICTLISFFMISNLGAMGASISFIFGYIVSFCFFSVRLFGLYRNVQ